jgi:hypothetical protein
MNNKAILKKLHEQSAMGRKVSMLLAYVTEHGPQPESVLVGLCGTGKPLRLAAGMSYLVLTPDGHYSLAPDGNEVVMWLLGKVSKPKSLATLEARATSFKKLKRSR